MLVENAPRPRMDGEDERLVQSRDRRRSRDASRSGSDVRLTVEREHGVRSGSATRRAPARERQEQVERVAHHVADDLDPARRLPRCGACRRCARPDRGAARRCRSTSIRLCSSGIDRSPLRRPASTCATGTPASRARTRTRERRVRVAEDEDGVRPRLRDRRRRAGAASRRRRPFAASSSIGSAEAELVEEHLRELGVVVLARVDDDLLDPRVAKRDRERRRLDELGPVADNGEDTHASQPREDRGRRATLVGPRAVSSAGRAGDS